MLKHVCLVALLVLSVGGASETITTPASSGSHAVGAIESGRADGTFSNPRLMSYQGKLTDTLGIPVPDTTYSVTFRLFTVPSGGSALWSESQDVRTEDGLFAVLLGSETSIDSVPAAGNLYLEMQVGASPAMTPRLRIASAAYAFLAARADSAGYADEATPVGTAGGDLAGSYPDPTVDGLQGRAVASAAPSANQVLKWTGSQWAPRDDSTGGTGTVTSVAQGTGVTCTPNPITATGTVSLNTSYADGRYVNEGQANSVTSAMIQSNAVTVSDIADTNVTMAKIARAGAATGEVIKWSGSAWAPGPDNTGGGSGVTNVYQDTGITCVPNPITTTGNVKLNLSYTDARYVNEGQAASGDLAGTYPGPSLAASGVSAGTYGSATQVSQFTVDAKGRLTSAGNVSISVPPSGPAGGDLAGTYPNPAIAGNAVGSAEVIDGSLRGADIAKPCTLSASVASGAVLNVTNTGGGDAFRASGTARFTGQIVSTVADQGDADGASGNRLSSSGGQDLAPLVVSSTTVCDNLNADLLDGSHASAFLSVGNDYGRSGVATDLYEGTSTLTSRYVNEGQAAGGDLSGTYPSPTIAQKGATSGQVLKWTGSQWAPGDDSSGGGDNAWTRGSPDSVLYTVNLLGIARGGADNMLYGNQRQTHVNLGVACTTGTVGVDAFYVTVGGGYANAAGGRYAAIAGGHDNLAGNNAVDTGAFVGGGTRNSVLEKYGTVAGGIDNAVSLHHATVGGGQENEASAAWATVAGGYLNTASGSYSTIAGGLANAAGGNQSTVGGGRSDTAMAAYSGVLSGSYNQAGDAAEDTSALVCGGYGNEATAKYATVGGGRDNTVEAMYGGVFAGDANLAGNAVEDTCALVCGGSENAATGKYDFVGGGRGNTADAWYGTVGGGSGNTTNGMFATIAGGMDNRTAQAGATVGGGGDNYAPGFYSTVPGGNADTARGWFSGALSGYGNAAGNSNSDTGAVVCGGYSNRVTAKYSTIGGGKDNSATNTYSTIGGGLVNAAGGVYSTIGGGAANEATGDYTTVGGGYSHYAASYATVAGGYDNSCTGWYGAVGGGTEHILGGYAGTIGGGQSDSVGAWYAGVFSGLSNLAGNEITDTAAVVTGGSGNRATAKYASIGGGYGSSASGSWSTVGGGRINTANAQYSTVSGGAYNDATVLGATIGGGYGHTADGSYATVPGGYGCDAGGDYSFAANIASGAAYTNSAAFNGGSATASSQTRVGILSKSSGSFTIDHPLDPYGKILNHYFIEGPEMRNIYEGSVVLDGSGRAEVTLPDYFSALNRNPHVQLTGVGTYEVYVAEKVSGNRFAIGGKPGTEVFWTVTGERKDVSAEATRRMMPVEQRKTGPLAGKMLDDEFISGCMEQLVREGKADGIGFRTAAGRQRYEMMRRLSEESGR